MKSFDIRLRGRALQLGTKLISLRDLAIHSPNETIIGAKDTGHMTSIMLASGREIRLSDESKPSVKIHNIGQLLTCKESREHPLGLLESACVIVVDGKIAWAGTEGQEPNLYTDATIDAGGSLVTPGLIDCHTHAVFAGSRAEEFAMRSEGANYLDIAKAGGGIASTVKATDDASAQSLLECSYHRLSEMMSNGMTTCEVKTGYSATTDGELRMLTTIKELQACHPTRVVPTLLPLHALPAPYQDSREAYISEQCETLLPKAAKLAPDMAVDAYCEQGAFSPDECVRLWQAATDLGLPVKGHLGQFSDIGGAVALANVAGLSADHMEHVTDESLKHITAANTTIVLLPFASTNLRQEPPDIARFRAAKAVMAVATDCNPGTSYCTSLPLAMWLAVSRYGLTVDEAWAGVTRHGAKALGRVDIGMATAGGRADLVLWNCADYREVVYRPNEAKAETILVDGTKATLR